MRRRALFGASSSSAVLAATRVVYGAFADNEPWTATSHQDLESLVGAKLQPQSWFYPMDLSLPESQLTNAQSTSHDIVIAWEPRQNNVPIPFADILAGQWDAHLTAVFQRAAQFSGTIIFRPFWEMNANAAAYSMAYNGSDKQVTSLAQWIDTWRYIVNLQRSLGSTNIKWFFCANGSDVGSYTMEQYYPGHSYVDYVGFDTYIDDWDVWKNFSNKISAMYTRCRAMAPTKYVALGEISCKEDGAPAGTSKAEWIADMFYTLRNTATFPHLKYLLWFHADKEKDWRANSSPDSLKAWQAGIRPIQNVVDTFDDTSLSKWPQKYGTASVVNGRCRIACESGYSGIKTANAWSIRGSTLSAQVFPPAQGGALTDANVSVAVDSSTNGTSIGVGINMVSNTISFFNNSGYYDGAAVSLPYDSTQHRWIKIQERQGIISWLTSPDGVQWTVQRTNVSSPAWINSGADHAINISTHRDSGSVDFAEIDSINTL